MNAKALIGLTATALVGGGAWALSEGPIDLPAPSVSAFTLTVPNRDSVAAVVTWTKRCDLKTKRCPFQWRVAIVAGDTSVARIRNNLRDTLRVEKPVCPGVLTVRAGVIADLLQSTGTISSPPGSTTLKIPCRPLNAWEKAFEDSFPAMNRKIVPARRWVFKDGNPKDSVLIGTENGAIQIPEGYILTLCHLRRNRYTGRVNWDAADPGNVCEAARVAYESERSG